MTAPSALRSAGVLALFLLACFGVSAIGGSVTAPEIGGWYRTLPKPWFNPPDWVFAPVWTVLYAVMAVAGWRVWRRAGFAGGRAPLSLFAVQLALNLAWSLLFFGAHAVGAALVDVLLLLAAVVATAVAFGRVDRLAGLLMWPYAAWVAYASLLNGAIWWSLAGV